MSKRATELSINQCFDDPHGKVSRFFDHETILYNLILVPLLPDFSRSGILTLACQKSETVGTLGLSFLQSELLFFFLFELNRK